MVLGILVPTGKQVESGHYLSTHHVPFNPQEVIYHPHSGAQKEKVGHLSKVTHQEATEPDLKSGGSALESCSQYKLAVGLKLENTLC